MRSPANASQAIPRAWCSMRTASPKRRCSRSPASSTTRTPRSSSTAKAPITTCARGSSRRAPRSGSWDMPPSPRITCCRAGHGAPTRARQKSKAGVVDVEMRGNGDERSIAIRQSRASGRAASSTIASGWRCSMRWHWPPTTSTRAARCASSARGSTRLIVGVRGTEPLKQLKPDVTRLTTLSAQLGAAGYFVFTLTPRQRGSPDGIAHVLPGARHRRGSGQRQRARAARRLSRHATGCSTRTTAPRRVHAALRATTCIGPGASRWSWISRTAALDGVWIIGQAVSIFETEIEL